MLLQKENLVLLLNKAFNQSGKIRKDCEITYYCTICSHPDKTKRKLEISLDGMWHCWRCGVAGQSFYSLFKKFKISSNYVSELSSILGTSFKNKNFINKNDEEIKICLPKEYIQLSLSSKSIENKNALYYLKKKRNITDIDILRYNIGYAEDGIYKNRIIIPSYDEDGNLNFFSARDYYNVSKFSYLLPPWNKNIIGFEYFINWKFPYITLVEGQFDAITVRKNAIPLFGKIMSNRLKEAIVENNVNTVNICLDNDALKDSLKLYNELNNIGVKNIKIIFMNNKDASECGFDKINNLIINSDVMTFDTYIKLKLLNK